MDVLFLIPGVISLILVLRGRVESAFLYVYLPALLLIPYAFAFRVPHLPAFSAAQWALLPIAAVAFKRQTRSGLPSLLDLLIVAFLISTAASEILHERVTNDGFFLAIDNFISIVLSYLVGRRMIEPNLRLAAVRQFVIVMLCLGPVSVLDWRLGQNLYGLIGERFFNNFLVAASIQMRSGHGRVSASFNDAELAGIVFAMTIALDAWLSYLRRTRSGANLGPRMSMMEKYHVPSLLLLMYLLMTQSRGPLLALGAGYLILQITRFRNTQMATCLVAAVLAVGAYGVSVYLDRYTNVSDPYAVQDEQQGSALYRRRMNELYKPIAEEGGTLGWGRLSYPKVPSMSSIDNEFLRVHLSYGSIGYVLFWLITIESMRSLLVRSWKLRGLEDKAFAISLLAAMATFWISISTVYMGEQLPQIAFLLMGWGQSIVPGSTEAAAVPVDSVRAKYAFRRVFN